LPEHPLELQREEIERSRSALATLTQQPIRAFAYPNGAFSDRTIDAVRIAGCAVAVTTGEGIVSAETNRLLLPRLWVKPSIGTAFGEWLGGWTSATVSVTG
jgi:peptidoglycan/xylan/chitin deacetylase (PgdA/CDA1 family)